MENSLQPKPHKMSKTFIDRDHTENLLQRLWRQRESEELCDIQLIAGTSEKKIPAHRCVLSAASEYFRELVLGSTSNEIELSQLDGDVLYSLIEFCYTGSIVITLATIQQLLETAKVLALGKVVSACADFLVEQLNPSNCVRFTMLLAENECELQLQMVGLKHFMEIRAKDGLHQLNAAQLGKLLASDELPVPAEEDAFDSLMEWIQYDRTEREKHQAELLKLVRLPLMQRTFLMERVKPVCTSPECLKVYWEAIEMFIPPQCELPKARKSIKPIEWLLAITHNPNDQNEKYFRFYCQQQRTWTGWPESLTFNEQHAIAKIEDNLYVLGGRKGGTVLAIVMCLYIKTMHLGEVGPMTECRANCCAAVLKGFLYAVGGEGTLGNPLSSVEKYCPQTKKWSKVASMNHPKSKFGIAVLNEKLYAVGCTESSREFECYDPNKNEWSQIFRIRKSCCLTGQMTVANDKVCLIGILNGSAILVAYDPETENRKAEKVEPGSLSSLFATGLWTTFSNKIIICHDNTIVEHDALNDQWKNDTSLGLTNVDYVFTYGDQLPYKNFVCLPGSQLSEIC